jgi:hypothetical protein
MRDQETIGLWEAYSSIYASQEEVETLNEAITSEKGKEKAAEMIAARSTPSGRAKSGKGANVAQIKHIVSANVDGYGGTPPNRKVAKNPVKSNFTGLNSGTGNKAAKRAAKLNKEEIETDLFDYILEHLVAEGYADTEEAALAIMANMSEDWRQSIVEADSIEAMRARAANRRKKRYGASDTSRGGRDDFRPYTEDDYKRPGPGSQAKES